MSTESWIISLCSIGVSLIVGMWRGVVYSKKRWFLPQLQEVEHRMEAKAQDCLANQSSKYAAMIPEVIRDIHIIADEMESGVNGLMDRLERLSDRASRDVGQNQQASAIQENTKEENVGEAEVETYDLALDRFVKEVDHSSRIALQIGSMDMSGVYQAKEKVAQLNSAVAEKNHELATMVLQVNVRAETLANDIRAPLKTVLFRDGGVCRVLKSSCIRPYTRFSARGFLALTKNAWFLEVPITQVLMTMQFQDLTKQKVKKLVSRLERFKTELELSPVPCHNAVTNFPSLFPFFLVLFLEQFVVNIPRDLSVSHTLISTRGWLP